MAQYKYRNLPFTGDEGWQVCGVDTINKSMGVLEWCHNEADAKWIYDAMVAASGQFNSLSYEINSER
jgi:hypothetical protein